MIMDRLERFRCYQRSVPELWDAVRFAERVQNTRSFEEADFEVHRNYLDVQILLNGSEMWEYADRADLAVKTPYDPEADIEWLSGCGNRIQMKPGMFYLVYPDDGHKPCCHEKEQTSYRKVVVKIKIDKLLHGVPAMERTAVYGKGDRRWI
jgi:YhcH/YjgK/YiaL family protein